MIASVSIPDFDSGSPVMYNVLVDLGQNIAPYTIRRRYNDFLKLASDIEQEMGEPVAVSPPPKPGIWQSVDLEARRGDLEVMLTALVRVPEFADSLAVSNFLDVYTHRRAPKSVTLDWIGTSSEIKRLISEAKSAPNVSYSRQRTMQARALVNQLERSLKAGSIGEGELNRRKQQLQNYVLQTQQIEAKSLDSGFEDPRSQLFTNSPKQSRVLGETSETRKLNNAGLVQQQQMAMDRQDQVLEDMLGTLQRQKELGHAINSELHKHNELLEELDGDVHRVNARLNEARRRTDRIN